jgi:hypothetical protein
VAANKENKPSRNKQRHADVSICHVIQLPSSGMLAIAPTRAGATVNRSPILAHHEHGDTDYDARHSQMRG